MVTSRIWFTAAQKAELWERWKNGQSAAAIARALERKNKSGVARQADRSFIGICPEPGDQLLECVGGKGLLPKNHQGLASDQKHGVEIVEDVERQYVWAAGQHMRR